MKNRKNNSFGRKYQIERMNTLFGPSSILGKLGEANVSSVKVRSL